MGAEIGTRGSTTPSTIGPTFAGADTTMTLANTFYTVATLAAALVAGGLYELGGSVLFQDAGVAGDTLTVEVRDSTNNVTIWTGEVTAGASLSKTTTVVIPSILYSGYAGTPTIILRCESSGAGDKVLQTALGAGAAANKATMLYAKRIG